MKIYIYAIAKNEQHNVKRWLNSIADADGVYVLDTGSTDKTVELLHQGGATVLRRTITPFRFDTARNLAMSLTPVDADVLVSIDLDETLGIGWRAKIEHAWKSDTTLGAIRCVENDERGISYRVARAHTRMDYFWSYPIREILTRVTDAAKDNGDERVEYNRNAVDLGVTVYHNANSLKRDITDLLETLSLEFPESHDNLIYLCREYLNNRKYTECIRSSQRFIRASKASNGEEVCAALRFAARAYEALGDAATAESKYLDAVRAAPQLKEPYIDAAKFYYNREDWESVVFMLRRAFAVTNPSRSLWAEDLNSSLPYDMMCVSLNRLGRHDLALIYAI